MRDQASLRCRLVERALGVADTGEFSLERERAAHHEQLSAGVANEVEVGVFAAVASAVGVIPGFDCVRRAAFGEFEFTSEAVAAVASGLLF